MFKRLTTIFCILSLSLTVAAAQEHHCSQADFGPVKGDILVGATVGYDSFVGKDAVTNTAASRYELGAASASWLDSRLSVGLEGSWFFTDSWALRFGGGIGYSYNPGYAERPGTFDGSSTAGDGSIPAYRAVGEASTLKYSVILGADRHFKHPSLKNLRFHAGLHGGFAHGLNQILYDEAESLGKSLGERYTLRAMLNAGADYYFLPGMFLGIEFNPFQYAYSVTTIRPQAGLAAYSADCHDFCGFASPTIKIGFKF